MIGIAWAWLCYALFNLVSLGFAAFLADLWLPHSVNGEFWHSPLPVALGVDLCLIALFGVQHSVMARAGFKRWFTRMVPPHLERSVYVLASSLVLAVLIGFWQPIPYVLWDLAGPVAAGIVWAAYLGGWALVLWSTHMIDHAELFGLAQAWRHWKGQAAPRGGLRTPSLYRHVRHPLYLGFLILLWAAPTMTGGRLLLAAGLTLYILIGMAFEERDLVREFGQRYRDYQRSVPALLPFLRFHQQASPEIVKLTRL